MLYLGRYEHELIQTIGLESRVQEGNSLLDVGSNQGVSMVGIYGIGVIG